MLNGLLKVTLIAAILRWLKPRYRLLLAAIVLVLVVNLAHSEYIEYVSITGRFDYLELSYFVKFVLWIVILGTYYLLAEVRVIVGKEQEVSSKKSVAKDLSRSPAHYIEESDGFDFLRDKKKLESKADKAIAGKSIEDVGASPGSGDNS